MCTSNPLLYPPDFLNESRQFRKMTFLTTNLAKFAVKRGICITVFFKAYCTICFFSSINLCFNLLHECTTFPVCNRPKLVKLHFAGKLLNFSKFWRFKYIETLHHLTYNLSYGRIVRSTTQLCFEAACFTKNCQILLTNNYNLLTLSKRYKIGNIQ